IDVSVLKVEVQLRRQQEVTAFFLSTCHSHQVIQKLKVMAGSLSHEIKTPMAGVRVGLELMKNFFEQSKKDKNQITVERLEEHEQRVNRMIQRISAGTALVNMQLKNMLVENIDTSQFQMNSARQCIQEAIHTFPFDDPAAVNKVHVSLQKEFDFLGDPLLTKHVLWNLLNNALYFMKEMGRGDIFISTDEKDGQHVIHFKDTAKGMPPEQAERVFEPFYTNRFGGSGLGLSFCLMVIQAYGGTITCQSVEGEYAEFSLFFPKPSV
nr:hypothetical protein [Legionellales bacterium]